MSTATIAITICISFTTTVATAQESTARAKYAQISL